MTTGQAGKPKTKAKQRYLKVKKERRKRKKTAAAEALRKNNIKTKVSGSKDVAAEHSKFPEEPSVLESEEKYDAMVTLGFQERDDHMSIQHLSPPALDTFKRSRKRRKAAQKSNGTGAETPGSSRSSLSPGAQSSTPFHAETTESSAGQMSTVTPLAGFPIPSVPNLEFQTTLSLQGLDPALVDAEIVDAACALSLVTSDDSTSRLSLKTRKRLKDLGIEELFAVQTALIPFLLPESSSKRALYMPYSSLRDVCVSAPTGSGKTLAYALPVLEVLSPRVVTRLRALIVLPTRDLVTQVRETFEAVSKGRGIKIGTATGQHSFTHEQSQLVDDIHTSLRGGSSKVDILICTPGRLIDHLNETPNFTLQHLRFLVIDEADRLLSQSFNDWLAQVLSAMRPPLSDSLHASPSGGATRENISHVRASRNDALSPAWLPFPSPRSHVDEKCKTSCQKLLFSATLTRDPAKISALELRDPKYFIVKDTLRGVQNNHTFTGEVFTFPPTLTERMIVCTSIQKPLVLFHLVYNLGVTNALVFTKSTESTVRLVKLFECFQRARNAGSDVPKACAYSSDLSAAERKTILDKFKAKEITILVCSDLISRGIDISHVSHVVSYDAPVDMRKYVHRVGRTARAGRAGDAWSLIEQQEARYFKSMLASADHLAEVRKIKMTEEDLKTLKDPYEMALNAYKHENS